MRSRTPSHTTPESILTGQAAPPSTPQTGNPGTRVQRIARRQLIDKHTYSQGIRPCSCTQNAAKTHEPYGSKLSPWAAHRTLQDRDPTRSGLRERQKQNFTNPSLMGLGKVAATLKEPLITPGGMLEWRRAAAAPRRRPTAPCSSLFIVGPRKIFRGSSWGLGRSSSEDHSDTAEVPKVNLKDL